MAYEIIAAVDIRPGDLVWIKKEHSHIPLLVTSVGLPDGRHFMKL